MRATGFFIFIFFWGVFVSAKDFRSEISMGILLVDTWKGAYFRYTYNSSGNELSFEKCEKDSSLRIEICQPILVSHLSPEELNSLEGRFKERLGQEALNSKGKPIEKPLNALKDEETKIFGREPTAQPVFYNSRKVHEPVMDLIAKILVELDQDSTRPAVE